MLGTRVLPEQLCARQSRGEEADAWVRAPRVNPSASWVPTCLGSSLCRLGESAQSTRPHPWDGTVPVRLVTGTAQCLVHRQHLVSGHLALGLVRGLPSLSDCALVTPPAIPD